MSSTSVTSPDLPYSLYHTKTHYYSITAYMKKTLRVDLYFLQHTSQVVALTNFSLPSFKLKNKNFCLIILLIENNFFQNFVVFTCTCAHNLWRQNGVIPLSPASGKLTIQAKEVWLLQEIWSLSEDNRKLTLENVNFDKHGSQKSVANFDVHVVTSRKCSHINFRKSR